MVKAIYNHWFIKFDYPETSKGRVYNSTLKKDIPQGWKVKSIKDCLIHINTGLNPRNNFTLNNGDVKYITVKNLTPNGSIDFSNCDTISQETKELINKRSLVSKGDILFASIAPLGRCVLVNETPSNWEINESVFSIRVNTEIVSPEYLFLFFMSDYFVKTAENSSTGSIFSGIRISTLEEMKVLIPEKNILEKFNSIVFPLLVKKYEIEQQNEKLKKLKDTLLPLLINGQLQ